MTVISAPNTKTHKSNSRTTNRRLVSLTVVLLLVSFVWMDGFFATTSSSSLSLEEFAEHAVFTKDAMVTTTTTNVDKQQQPPDVYFHHYKKGASGVVIHDMLLCHAYAWNHNAIYGGSCGEPTELHKTHERLLESVGLLTELPFQCPKHHSANNTNTRRKTIPRSVFQKEDTQLWNPGYVDYLKRHVVRYPIKTSPFTIAVHIRRGKFSPCAGTVQGYDPYLPNAHYQRLIDKYMQPNARVVIFSQKKSFESFDAFQKQQNYEVYLDEDITHVWKTMLVADVVIQSRSSFSLIPAVVSKGTVVYTPFWHAPLEGWDVVGDDLLRQTNQDMAILRKQCPP